MMLEHQVFSPADPARREMLFSRIVQTLHVEEKRPGHPKVR
jgi:hypothetical protein